jgi:hypothetical protein
MPCIEVAPLTKSIKREAQRVKLCQTLDENCCVG